MGQTKKIRQKSSINITKVALVILLLILAVVSGLVMFKRWSHMQPIQLPPKNTVLALKASTTPYSPTFKLLGKVRSINESNLSSPISSIVSRIAVREGEPVSKGQLLVQLDTKEAQLLYYQQHNISEQRRAELKELELAHQRDLNNIKHRQAVLKLNKKRLLRQEKLLASNLAAQAQYDIEQQNVLAEQIAVADLQLQINSYPQQKNQLQSQLQASIAKEQQLALDLKRLSLIAPFNGVIDQRLAAVGERVNANQSIISLYDLEQLEVVANIPTRYQEAINKAMANKQPVTAHVPNTNISLTLDYVGQIIGDGELAQKGYFKIDQAVPLMHNSIILFEVKLPQQPVIAIPGESLYPNNTVYLIEQGKLVAEHVEVVAQLPRKNAASQPLLVKATPELQGKTVLSQYLANAKSGMAVTVN